MHPYRWTSLGLSLIEAMYLAMPVVVLAATEAPRAVPPQAGAISTDLTELPRCRQPLHSRPAGRTRAGLAAREAACARYGLKRFLRKTGTRFCRRHARMRIAMVSEHADPTAVARRDADAGGQNVHVGALSRGTCRIAVIWSPCTPADQTRTSPATSAEFGPGVIVRRLPGRAGRPLPKDELLPFMRSSAIAWPGCGAGARPTSCMPISGCPGWPHCSGAAGTGALVVQTFHALGMVKARYQGPNDTSPASRVDSNATSACTAIRSSPPAATKPRSCRPWASPDLAVSVVPCGVDTVRLHARRRGRAAPIWPAEAADALGRLVERKGMAMPLRRWPGCLARNLW